jgi:hypothetical protein
MVAHDKARRAVLRGPWTWGVFRLLSETTRLACAALWSFLVNWVVDNRFEDPKLLDGMHLSVTGVSPNLQVHVTGRGSLGHFAT